MANSGGKDATLRKSKSNSRASLSRSPNRIVVKWSRSATIQRSTTFITRFLQHVGKTLRVRQKTWEIALRRQNQKRRRIGADVGYRRSLFQNRRLPAEGFFRRDLLVL